IRLPAAEMADQMEQKKVENVIVVGGGPAGYTAALYTARANLEPLVFEGFQWGGQLQNTTDVENYPGYPEGIMGPEMMNQFRAQAERFGTRFVSDDVDRVELGDGGVQRVFLGDEEHLARTVILAMGAEPRRLGIPGEMELSGRGVSTCGVCDGANLDHVRLRNAETGESEDFGVEGAFVAIGHIPKSEIVADQVETDEDGYIRTQPGSTRTNLAGVFAVGDVVDRTYRQAVTAAGTGCMGALDAEWYLRDTPPSPEAHWMPGGERAH